MPAFGLISAAIGLGTGIYTIAHNASQQKKAHAAADAALRNRPSYHTSPAALAAAADAQSRVGALDPAVAAGYGQAQQQVANQMGAAERNASSGAEALAAGAHAQGQFYNALPSLIGAQSQYQQQNLKNYYGTQGQLAEEDHLKAQDNNAAFGDQLNYNLGLEGAAQANIGQGLGLVGTSLGSLGNYAGQYRKQPYIYPVPRTKAP